MEATLDTNVTSVSPHFRSPSKRILKLDTNAKKVNEHIPNDSSDGTPSPISPSFRRTLLPNMRQSWVFNKPPPIPETESVILPRPILDKNGLSAKSRLSLIVQKSAAPKITSGIFFKPLEQDKVVGASQQIDTDYSIISEAATKNAEQTDDSTLFSLSPPVTELFPLSNRPLSDSSLSTGLESDYDISSDSIHSFSSSVNIITPDSISEIGSTLSVSPTLNGSQSSNAYRFPNTMDHHVHPHRYSMPSSSQPSILNESHQSEDSLRPSSMPILSTMESTSSVSGSPDSFPSKFPSIPENEFPSENEDTFSDLQDSQNRKKSRLGHLRHSSSNSSDDSDASNMSMLHASVASTSAASILHAHLSLRKSLRKSLRGSLRGSLRMSAASLMQKRLNIAWEILTTERHYVNCLLLVQKLFLTPLLHSLSTYSPILSKKSINDIFANLLDIISLNTELLRMLENRIMGPSDNDHDDDDDSEPWNPEEGCLGDIFLNMGPFFKMYSIYVRNFNSALAVIDVQLRESPAFSAFLRDVIKTGQCKGLTLQAYLIMPVQRIPRYKLLLEDLLKKTEETHPDYLNIKKAYQVIEQVATFVNETIRQHEMFITMLEIQKSLTGFDEVLLVPARRFIKRGTVKKICRRNHQERDFFLFSDILIYASPGIIENLYTFHRKFDLEDVTVLSLEDNTAGKNSFQIMSPQKSFTLYTDTRQEKESWINAIRDAKEEYLSAKRTLKIAENMGVEREDTYKKRIVENYHAPVWVPDSSTDKCMNCSYEFTFFRRKHHCRACGKVICHDCSTRTFVIAGSSERDDQVVRACDSCFFTMFPDALRDEDIAPGIRVWDLVKSGTPSTSTRNSGASQDSSIRENKNIIASRKSYYSDNKPISTIKNLQSIHEAIVARKCQLCQIDFNVFRWRNVCFKCKNIVCTDCITKKPIDLSLLPESLILEMIAEQQQQRHQPQVPPENPRDSMATFGIRLCDVCFLGIDPNRVIIDQSGGGWMVDSQLSPPMSPQIQFVSSGVQNDEEGEQMTLHNELGVEGYFEPGDIALPNDKGDDET